MRFLNVFQRSFAKIVLLSAAFVLCGAAAPVVTAQSRNATKPQVSLMPEAEKLLADMGY